MRRIARGIQKFVIDNPEPFIIPIGYGEREWQSPRVNSVDEPLGTVVTSGKHYLVAPTLIQYHSETAKDEVRGQKLTEPLMTQDTSNRYAVSVAHIMKNYAGGYKGAGSAADAPLGTVTAKDHNSLVTAHIMTLRNNQDGQAVDEPLSTVTSGAGHHAEVQTFLVKYFSTGAAKSVNEPLDTVTTKDRFCLVTLHGEQYIITDIRMRMLQPRELFNAQGFPHDYVIDHDADGHPYPKSKQVARCGNSVTPQVPAALVRANLPEYCGKGGRSVKSILISIRPMWCELIASGKKTIEVRKTRPKIETPFKCYIYCTGVKSMNLRDYVAVHQATGGAVDDWSGKVIGEFVCDGVYKNNMSYDCEGSCVSVSELKEYANGKPLYGWRISDLKIYDKPKELGNFRKAAWCPYMNENGCTYKYHCFRVGQAQRCGEALSRPPQSWCYTEERS